MNECIKMAAGVSFRRLACQSLQGGEAGKPDWSLGYLRLSHRAPRTVETLAIGEGKEGGSCSNNS